MAIPSDPQTPTTLNIPSLVAFAVISFFAIRYFFFSPSSSGQGAATSSSSRNGRRVDPQRIETVLQMFPQLSRRDIEWDLVRNGGSVQATTDRVLREGRLDVPPPNFRAQEAPVSSGAAGAGGSGPSRRNATPAQQKQAYPDLITRYKLASRLGMGQSSDTSTDKGKGKEKSGWSTNKAERQAALQKRRDEMVLAARRKMEERDRQQKA